MVSFMNKKGTPIGTTQHHSPMDNNFFPPALQDDLKYYVYRLVDPRDNSTFYVGKGKGNRVFEHAKAAIKFGTASTKKEDEEDEVSAKIQQIKDILAEGKEVITILQRRGLEENEAFEVEAALIDVFPELTNIQSGHHTDRGMINTEELIRDFYATEFEEPIDIEYVIIKTSRNYEKTNGNLYEATRRAWKADLTKAKKYKYVLSVIYGMVEEVYEVERWYKSRVKGRIEFEGDKAPEEIRTLFIGKMIPAKYRTKGLASPFLYKK